MLKLLFQNFLLRQYLQRQTKAIVFEFGQLFLVSESACQCSDFLSMQESMLVFLRFNVNVKGHVNARVNVGVGICVRVGVNMRVYINFRASVILSFLLNLKNKPIAQIDIDPTVSK